MPGLFDGLDGGDVGTFKLVEPNLVHVLEPAVGIAEGLNGARRRETITALLEDGAAHHVEKVAIWPVHEVAGPKKIAIRTPEDVIAIGVNAGRKRQENQCEKRNARKSFCHKGPLAFALSSRASLQNHY
ncbi:hypothetical protein [uncultured Rhodoblastus sp.]|uniref:hypothetical protein n=1 Tax=uncultured Rhodoblastus sp. TaxID=543037 RepID=UPI0025D730DD|nr:hypothetical protein [uncultured Rhodoblastus sp.]